MSVSEIGADIAVGCAVLCFVSWWGKQAMHTRKFKRAFNQVKRDYGAAVVDRLSTEQVMALAGYTGPKPPDLVTETDAERNRWAPETEAEARAVVSNIVLAEQLRRAVDDPHHARQFTFGDAGPAPKIADGRAVDYNLPPRRGVRLSPAYYKALEANEKQMAAFLAARATQPALAWEKPDHMTLHPDPHYEPLSIEGAAAMPMIEGPTDRSPPSQVRWDGTCYMKDGAPCRRKSECREHEECMIAMGKRQWCACPDRDSCYLFTMGEVEHGIVCRRAYSTMPDPYDD